ncbi:MAG: twin-arginine translocase TatA/TatE family subunit [Candidatus Shapirobacteria bacterium]|jgi:sec-independent protein translocase protein TatA
MFNNIGTTEILVIILVLIVLFGGNKIADVAKGLGEATKEFKKAQKEVENTKAELKKEPIIEDEPSLPTKKKKLKTHHLKKNKK